MDECNHLWRPVDGRTSQCAKCGECVREPSAEEKRIADLKSERDRLYQVLESIGCHPDAEPTIQEIARGALKEALLREEDR